ncbi:MAG: acyl-CoA dehydrogenase protein [Aeromicrobium sp.]|nr:acyl-CoA dehydrogenase protein [Aeromicrobium sp.]
MTLLLDADQRDLQTLVRSFLSKKWPTSSLMDEHMGRPPATSVTWSELAEDLDVVGLAVPEAFGGSDGTLTELAVVAREMGRALYTGPYLSTAALAVTSLMESGDDAAMSAHLPRIARGELTIALAGLHEVMEGTTSQLPVATGLDGDWTLDGSTRFVMDVDGAEYIFVFGQVGADVALFQVAAGAHGLSTDAQDSLDLTRRLATVGWASTPAVMLGAPDRGHAIARRVRMTAAVLVASEDIGAAEQCLDMAVRYAKDRKQFGRPIGSFQSIKHRCADMLLAIEAAKAAAAYAGRAVRQDADDAETAALNAHAACSDALHLAATSAGQVFGGIGYTWEHPMHLYLRRAVASRFLFGTAPAHRDEVLQRHLDAL